MPSQLSQKLRNIRIHPLIILGIISFSGAIIRLYHLGYKPIWLDEAVIYWISNQESISEIISLNALKNSAPPLFVLLLRIIIKIGDSEIVLRSLPWVAGVISLPANYFLARQFIDEVPALTTTLLVAIARTQVAYSQELREYSLSFLLAILILLYFNKFIKKPKIINLGFMTLFMIIGVFTQYGLSLLILSLNIIFLFELFGNKEDRKGKLLLWTGSQILVLLCVFLVIYLSLGEQMTVGFGSSSEVNYLSSSYWNGSIKDLIQFSFQKTYALFSFAFSGSIFLLLTFLGLIFTVIRKSHRQVGLLFLIPTLLAWLLSLFSLYPYDGRRQLMFLTPMIYILAGTGINYIYNLNKKSWAIYAILLFPLISGGISTIAYLNNPGQEQIRPVVNELKQSYTEGDAIYVYYGAEAAFTYYYREPNSSLILGVYGRDNPNKYFEQIDDVLNNHDAIWLVFSHCSRNECQIIPKYFSEFRNVDLVVSENDAYLYYVHE